MMSVQLSRSDGGNMMESQLLTKEGDPVRVKDMQVCSQPTK